MISISTTQCVDRSFLFEFGGGRLKINQANLKQDRIKETKILFEDFISGGNMFVTSLFKPLSYEKKIKQPCDRHHQNIKIIQEILKLIFIKYFSCCINEQ